MDPSKTLHAPYSQGNVAVFGQNAGQQLDFLKVRMSLSPGPAPRNTLGASLNSRLNSNYEHWQ